MRRTTSTTLQRTLIAAGLGLALATLPASAETRQIDRPTLDGLATDRCLSWNTDCDWAAAHELCARGGYTRALDWTWAYKGQTKTLRSGEICTTGPGVVCGGFLDVTCARGPGVLPPEPPGAPQAGGLDLSGNGPATGAAPAPGPSWTPPATFAGTIRDYAVEIDPPTGDWIVTDIRPGSPEGTVRVGIATPYLQFSDGAVPGPTQAPDPAGLGFADPTGRTGGMTDEQIEDAYDATGFTPDPETDDSMGSGVVLARLTRSAHDCYETGPSPSRLYTHCDLTYSLTNTSTETIFWTSGEWETDEQDGDGMDRRSIGYGTKSFKPGETREFKTWCIVPTGEARGSWAAWGSAQYYGSGDDTQFSWRLTATCP